MLYPERADGRLNKYAYASTLAASLIYLLMHQQDACGLVLFDHKIREQIAPTSSTAHLRSMIELIERNPPDNTTDVKILFGHLAEHVHQRGLVVVISDLLTDLDALAAGLQRLRYTRHDVIVLHVMDHDELEFPFENKTLFEGLEAPNIQLLTDPQSLRTSYLGIVQNFITQVRSACVNHRIDYCLLSTHDPLDAGLAAYLAGRMHRLTK